MVDDLTWGRGGGGTAAYSGYASCGFTEGLSCFSLMEIIANSDLQFDLEHDCNYEINFVLGAGSSRILQ